MVSFGESDDEMSNESMSSASSTAKVGMDAELFHILSKVEEELGLERSPLEGPFGSRQKAANLSMLCRTTSVLAGRSYSLAG